MEDDMAEQQEIPVTDIKPEKQAAGQRKKKKPLRVVMALGELKISVHPTCVAGHERIGWSRVDE